MYPLPHAILLTLALPGQVGLGRVLLRQVVLALGLGQRLSGVDVPQRARVAEHLDLAALRRQVRGVGVADAQGLLGVDADAIADIHVHKRSFDARKADLLLNKPEHLVFELTHICWKAGEARP